MLKRLFLFFVYSNLFIAGCAVLMMYQTTHLFFQEDPGFDLTCFVLFSTICSYSFHWYLTSGSVIPSERIGWLKKNRYVHIILFMIGLGGSTYFFLHLLSYWFWLLIAAFATFLYSAPKIPHPWFRFLRRVAIGKTIFLAFIWMYVTSILPLIVSETSWNGGMTLYAVSRFFFIYAICILFDYRDRADDKAAGVRSLITYLGEKSISILFHSSIIVSITCTFLLQLYVKSFSSVIILIIPAIITWSLYDYARKNFNDLFYYFVLDGLMAFSAIIMLISSI